MKWLAAIAWFIFLETPWLRVLATLWPVCGVALVGYGAWLIYEPAGYIAVGLLLILDSLHASSQHRAPK